MSTPAEKAPAEDKKTEKKTEGKNAKGPDSANDAGMLASPKVAAAIKAAKEIKELVHTSKSTKSVIGDRVRGLGFRSLNINSTSRQSVFRKPGPVIDQLTAFFNRLPIGSHLREECMQQIGYLVDESVESHKMQECSFFFASPAAGGTIEMHYFTFHMDTIKGKDKWFVSSASISGTFQTMPDWYISTKTSSKKSLLRSSSSSVDEIVYVDRGVTKEDISDLLMIVMPAWAGTRHLLENNAKVKGASGDSAGATVEEVEEAESAEGEAADTEADAA